MTRLLFLWAMPRALVALGGFYAMALTAWSIAP